MTPLPVPLVRLSGTDYEAGVRYGQQAAGLIGLSIDRYAAIFAGAGFADWDQVVHAAMRYEAPVAEYAPGSLEQMRGIADGAGLQIGDILALNARSELMFGVSRALDDGCTSLTVMPERAADGRPLLAQNWDWTVRAAESLVLLARHGHDRPGYVALVEAGLLSKTGMNTAGLGLCTNTLVSDGDDGATGVPYHVILHQLIQLERVSDGLQFVYATPRALSANYLLAHADGTALDIETGPGGPETVAVITPADGVITHTNHFQTPALAVTDRRVRESAHTVVRLDRVGRRVAAAGPKVDAAAVLDCLTDHAGYPLSVCLHPDPRRPPGAQFATLATVLYDLPEGQMSLSVGNPCESGRTQILLAELLQEAP